MKNRRGLRRSFVFNNEMISVLAQGEGNAKEKIQQLYML